jgi:hypothetical protein
MSQDTFLDTPQMVRIIIACLVSKLGGKVSLNQDDIDKISYQRLIEYYEYPTLTFTLKEPTKQ